MVVTGIKWFAGFLSYPISSLGNNVKQGTASPKRSNPFYILYIIFSIYNFSQTKKDLVVLARQCCLFCLMSPKELI